MDVKGNHPLIELDIRDIADVTYLKLASDADFITRTRPKCLSDNYVVTNGAGQGEILVFDAQGNTVSRFSHQGNGPHEYLYANEIFIDEAANEIAVHDAFLRKLFVYHLNGDFVREIPVEKSGYLYPIDGNSLLSYDFDNRVKKPERPAFSVLSKADGKTLAEFAVPIVSDVHDLVVSIETDEGVFAYSAMHLPVVKTGDGFLLNPLSADTIYKYSAEGSCRPYIARTPALSAMNDPVYLQAGVETSRYIFLRATRIDADSEEDMFPSTSLVYDKDKRKVHQCKVINADYPELAISLDAQVVDHVDKTGYGVIRLVAGKLKTTLEDGKLHGQLKEIAKGLQEEDNDVLMLLKFK